MITDTQKELLVLLYYDRGIMKKEIRSYEVSLWTLQDDFMTVLKWSDVEQKGRIENPMLTLNVDGTLKFTFSIPMYYRKNGKLIENPNWYTVSLGLLIMGLRKVKVIFNKDFAVNNINEDWLRIFPYVYLPSNYNGNVDLSNRKIVPASSFIEKGYSNFSGDYGTIFSSSNTYTASDGLRYDVIYTPIKADGTVLSASEMTTYLNSIISSSTTVEDWLIADANSECLLLGIFPEDDDHYNVWTTELHNMLAEWDLIRAKNNWFDQSSNSSNITFDEPNYEYYMAYLRSKSVFELLITKVTESHEQDQLRCNVECEGLAFHELGKLGYKYDLSQDNFLLNLKEWDECTASPKYWTKRDGTHVTTEPRETVLYWCEQCDLVLKPGDSSSAMRPNIWYYSIQMNWKSFNNTAINRSSNKVYEEEYVTSWDDPVTHSEVKEKERPVNVRESNIYNITLAIAEAFKIYCRYEYGYDENYHIISRLVIFYNNYFDETNVISFTYPYSTRLISRELDATELTTKMYVRPQDNDTVVSGQIDISMCTANKTKEDYLLNFDYMYNIGAITKELYDKIKIYEIDMRDKNITLENMSLLLAAYEETRIKQEALAAVYEKSITLDEETLNKNKALYGRLDGNDGILDGYFTRTAAHPYSTYIKQDSGGRYYITLSTEDKGLKVSSLLIYRVYNSANTKFKNLITNYTVVPDEYGYPKELTLPDFTMGFDHETTRVIVTPSAIEGQDWDIGEPEDDPTIAANVDPPHSDSALVYLLYKYLPKFYYDEVNKIWTNKLDNDKQNYETAHNAATDAKNSYDSLNAQYLQKLIEKNEAVLNFNRLMGPALREGYWQPEDYKDYGDNKTGTGALSNVYATSTLYNGTGTGVAIGWDSELFDDENKNYYEESVLRSKVYYPCVELSSSMITKIGNWLRAGKTPSFIFNNNYYKPLESGEDSLIQNLTMFAIGSQALLGFIVQKNTTTVKPVLILTGTDSMTDELIAFMKTRNTNKGNPRIGVATPKVHNDVSKIIIESGEIELSSGHFISTPSDYFIVYPRIKISSNDLNTSSIVIKYNNAVLENFDDYEILSRTTIRSSKAYFEYFITIKPKTLFRTGSYTSTFDIAYTLSNAATCIYLDALEVLRDSSKPRASYTVDINALDSLYLNTLYKDLTQLVMINDTQLKFDHVFGYISLVELNLDKPWEDKIEVKNYKTKFEDLFSTIVASSENMRANLAAYDAAANGLIPLTSDALILMITDNTPLLTQYIDTTIGGSAYVKAMLADIFTEAGAILASSNTALNNVRALTLRNADILSGFVENISADLIPKVVNSKTQPKDFKVGDIWNLIDDDGNLIGRYVATSGSDDAAGGYTRTFDGTLALIKGASLNADAVSGKIEILAENQIDMKSGGNIYIAANEKVDVVGNKAVNIGGGTINIAGSTNAIDGSTTNYTSGGINIISSGLNFSSNASSSIEDLVNAAIADTTGSISKVLIHPTKIEMGSADIIMKGARKILSVASDGDSSGIGTSAILISTTEGIWIGSGAGVRLYSGAAFTYNDTTKTISLASDVKGANVELMPDHLTFGVSNTDFSTTAMKMTDSFIILGAGDVVQPDAWLKSHHYNKYDTVTYGPLIFICKTEHDSTQTFDISKWDDYKVDGTSNGIIGAKFTKNSIGFATLSGNNINAILMNDRGITIGSGNFNLDVDISILRSNGSYVRIASNGIDIGSSGHLYMDTANLLINSGALLSDILGLYYYTEDSQGNSIKNTALSYSLDYGLFIKGNITATTFLTWVNNATAYFKADSNGLGFYKADNSSLLTMTSNGITAYSNLSFNSTASILLNGGTINMTGGSISLSSGNTQFTMTGNSLLFAVNSILLLRIDPTGTIIPKGLIGDGFIIQLKSDNIKGGLVSYGEGSPTMGFIQDNGSDGIPFWINMPPNTTNNNTDDIKTAFYYKNGKVYIRDLVLYNTLEYSLTGEEFNEDSPGTGGGGSSSGGGSSGGGSSSNTYRYISNNIYSHQVIINDSFAYNEGHNGATCTKCGATGCYGWS